MLDCFGCGEDLSLVAPVRSPDYSEVSTRAPKFGQDHSLLDGTHTRRSSPEERENQIQLRQNELVVRELRRERNQLLGELRQAKREIKMLRTEQGLNRSEIDKLRQERKAVQEALNGESRDALDSLFGW